MPHHDTTALSGVIRHVFAHRFVVEADGKVHLADLGPKGLEAFPVLEGLAVTLKGEQRPSEIKVTHIAAPGRAGVEIEHEKPNHSPGKSDADADSAPALAVAKKTGWTGRGDPRRKPKHFELLARQGEEGDWTELHIDLDGTIRKTKPADAEKWAAELA